MRQLRGKCNSGLGSLVVLTSECEEGAGRESMGVGRESLNVDQMIETMH
jgi:hypothetical protein